MLLSEIRSFLDANASLEGGDGLLIAFSGGPDSTALALGLKHIQSALGIELHTLHVDHGLDSDSSRRAHAAGCLSRDLGIPFIMVRSPVGDGARPRESAETAARRIRYRTFETVRRAVSARFVLTAHHADDQIETVLLRMLFGTGLEGLSGVRARHGNILRPLLTCSRSDLRDFVQRAGLWPVEDPTNEHLEITRNRIRHRIRPRLESSEPGLGDRIRDLASAALSVRNRLEARLRPLLDLRRGDGWIDCSRQALLELPVELWPFALSLIHRESGLPYPASRAARAELARQMRDGGIVGCDCGKGWRWESRGERIRLERSRAAAAAFAYTVEAPGECEITELGLRFRIRQGAVASWMFRPSSRRAGLALPIEPGQQVVVRNRRAGDRVRPFGCQYSRRLKDVLIDRRVPRMERSRLPLLEVESRLAWIPGVTIDNGFRIEDASQVWIAELESI